MSDNKCYDVLTVISEFFCEYSQYYIQIERPFIADHFLLEDHNLKITHK